MMSYIDNDESILKKLGNWKFTFRTASRVQIKVYSTIRTFL